MNRTGQVLSSARNTFDHRNRTTRHFQPLEIERNRQKRLSQRIDQVTGRQVAGIAASFY